MYISLMRFVTISMNVLQNTWTRQQDLVFCKHNVDCNVPKICCHLSTFSYCCVPEKWVPAPIPIYENDF